MNVSNTFRIITALLLWGALILLRVVHLDSDAYARLSWSSALLTDEGFYIHNARNIILFGQMRTDEFNNALIMPLLHLVQVVVFTLCGVGAIQARLISVACSLLTLAVFFCALRRAFGSRAAWLGLALLGLDPVFALYNRLALMDTPACLPLCAAFYAWTRTKGKGKREKGKEEIEDRRQKTEDTQLQPLSEQTNSFSLFPFPFSLPWLLLCGGCLGLAYTVRGLAAVIVPVPFVLLLVRREGSRRSRVRDALLLFVGLLCVLAPYALLWYLPHRQEMAHANAYYTRQQLLPQNGHVLLENIERGLFNGGRGMLPYLLKHSTALTLLAISYAATCLCSWAGQWLGRWKQRDTQQKSNLQQNNGRQEDNAGLKKTISTELFLAGWLLPLLILTLCVNYAPSRYYVLFYPPLAGFAAIYADQLLSRVQKCLRDGAQGNRHKALAHLFVTNLFIVGWIAGGVYWYADWLLHLSYRQRDADRWLAANLPPDSVLIGAVSPGLSMNNRFRCVNVIENLCNDEHPVEDAAPTPRYIVLLDREAGYAPVPASSSPGIISYRDKWADRWKERYWLRRYPDLVQPQRRIKAFPNMLRPFFTIGVYPVPEAYSQKTGRNGKVTAQP